MARGGMSAFIAGLFLLVSCAGGSQAWCRRFGPRQSIDCVVGVPRPRCPGKDKMPQPGVRFELAEKVL